MGRVLNRFVRLRLNRARLRHAHDPGRRAQSLSGLSSPISSATLTLDAGTVNIGKTHSLTSTTSSAATLIAAGGGATVFRSLGSGTLFDSIDITPAMANTTLTMNAAGLAHINANLGGQLVFSGALAPSTQFFQEKVFGSTASASTTLHLIEDPGNPVIPLPTGTAMAMVAMGLMGVRRRRR
jgi:hypothetical protein